MSGQAEVEASWAGRRQAAVLGRQDEEKRAAEAAKRLGVARERAEERERQRLQQDAALQVPSSWTFVVCFKPLSALGLHPQTLLGQSKPVMKAAFHALSKTGMPCRTNEQCSDCFQGQLFAHPPCMTTVELSCRPPR